MRAEHVRSGPPRLWPLVMSGAQIDPEDLLAAVRMEAREPSFDYRTRLLIHESLEALANRLGREELERRLDEGPQASRLGEVLESTFDERGFPSLQTRLVDTTRPETVLQFLRELGERIASAARIEIGGSTALILGGLLSRHTEDIDVVDEVPEAIRAEHTLLQSLSTRYGVSLARFQSHYLSDGWRQRTRPMERFGRLDVRLIDPLDIFVGKLFSRREKDLDDLRALATRFGRVEIEERLNSSAKRMLDDPSLRANAAQNWRIVFGSELPLRR